MVYVDPRFCGIMPKHADTSSFTAHPAAMTHTSHTQSSNKQDTFITGVLSAATAAAKLISHAGVAI